MDRLNLSPPYHKNAVKPQPNIPLANVTTAALAIHPKLTKQAYRIRYDAYHSSGNLASLPDQIFHDKYDCQPNFRTALVFKDDVAAATVRIGLYQPPTPECAEYKLPVMEIFGSEIEAILSRLTISRNMPAAVEIGRLARSPAFEDDSRLVFALFRVAGYAILHFDADVVFNAVRVHHIPMYRRFGFQQLGEPRLYPGLTCKMGLMACFRPSYATARSSLPFLRGISKDDAAYAGLIAGERVAIFGDNAPSAVRPAGPVVPLSQTPDGLRNCA
ncbi:N-acyl amino acid synthase FeeM domain-containing protein [Acidiphilium acidophilum]|uniref:N-acyl amino acid synthase FeeM catalytic core domain-containing protein n=1 Tax=Acidiphilium acidophilum TaxID=76588 RepID=A0AAW9DR37_ACIAO|nr:hypothetical protein [Acidiphilium acidophilum]MDX5930522.1 hypothetical protein [Acidiphilium acidophilum]GBQ08958.1 hypothetical protein AA700_0952 [Acidiphilium acidophilum DSM 700]